MCIHNTPRARGGVGELLSIMVKWCPSTLQNVPERLSRAWWMDELSHYEPSHMAVRGFVVFRKNSIGFRKYTAAVLKTRGINEFVLH